MSTESTYLNGDNLDIMTKSHEFSINKSRNKTKFGAKKPKLGLKLSSAKSDIGFKIDMPSHFYKLFFFK